MDTQNEGVANLKGYFLILYKRKIGIIIIFLVAVIIGIVITLTTPKTFEVVALLQIAQIDGQDIENVNKIKVIFSSDAVLKELIDKLNLPSGTIAKSLASKFDIIVDQKSDLLEVRGRGNTPEKALEMVNVVVEKLKERHQTLVSQARSVQVADVKQIQDQIKDIEVKIDLSQKIVKNTEADIQIMQKKMDNFIEEKGIVSEGRGLIIQSYIETVQNSRERLEGEQSRLESFKVQKINLEKNLRQHDSQKVYNNRPTDMVLPAVLPQTKIAPNNRQNVKVAGFFGLLIGILYAFTAEYISQNRHVNKAIE